MIASIDLSGLPKYGCANHGFEILIRKEVSVTALDCFLPALLVHRHSIETRILIGNFEELTRIVHLFKVNLFSLEGTYHLSRLYN
jgi:hypothetical protein